MTSQRNAAPSANFLHDRRWRHTAAHAWIPLLLAVSFAAPATAQWYWRHPQPQGNRLNSVDFADALHGTAVGDSGTILTTTDGGKSWLLRDSEVSQFPGADIDHVAFADEANGLAGVNNAFEGGGARIIGTTDGGVTWEIRETFPVRTVGAISFVGDTAMAVGRDYRSSPSRPMILRSTDSGITWEQLTIDPSLPYLWDVAVVDENTATVVGNEGTVLRTTDGGETWVARDSGTDQWLVGVSFPNPEIGIAVGGLGTIVRSTDGGDTWAPAQVSGPTAHFESVSFADGTHGAAVGRLHEAGEEVTAGVVFTTSDGGETWALRETFAECWTHCFSIDLGDASTGTIVRNDGSILRTEDGGSTWSRQSTRLVSVDTGLRAVSYIDRHTAVAVGGCSTWDHRSCNGAILRTEDGGNTWVAQESGTTMLLLGVSFVDRDFGIAVGGLDAQVGNSDGVILRTTDGGGSWTDVTPADLPNERLTSVSCTGTDTCTVVGWCGNIVRTEDGGDSWTVQRDCEGPRLQDVDFLDANMGIAVGPDSADRNILHTTDGGITWVLSETSPAAILDEVAFIDADTAVAVGWFADDSFILRTTDGGVTWVVQQNLPAVPKAIDFVDASNGVVMTWSGGVYRTQDGGESWQPGEDLPETKNHEINGISFADAATGMVVGQHTLSGATVFKTVGSPTFTLGLSQSHPALCVPDDGTEDLSIGITAGAVAGYSGTVALSTAGEPSGVTSNVTPASVAAPGGALWTVTVDGTVALGRHVLTLTGDDGADPQIAHLRLDVVDPAQAPTLVEPTDSATNVVLEPTFEWEAVAPFIDTYRIQVSTDAAFDELVIDQEVTGTSLQSPVELASDTEHFWRVQGTHGCAGAWSEVFSFTTMPVPKVEISPETLGFEVPVGSSDSATLTIANVGTGDLVWSVDTAQPPTAVTNDSSRRAAAPRGALAPLNGRSGKDSTLDLPSVLKGGSPSGHSVKESSTGAALDLSPVPGRGSSSFHPANPVSGVGACENEPGLIVHDDGTVENAYHGNPEAGVTETIFVDHFTPSGYPASLSAVCVAFISLDGRPMALEIVVFDDDGPDGGPGTELGALTATTSTLPGPDSLPQPVWLRIPVSSLDVAIDSGGVYIGVRWSTASYPDEYLAADHSPEAPVGFAGGYWWNDVDNAWVPTEDTFPAYRSMFVRAVENPGGCLDPSSVSWLSVTSESGSTPAGGSSVVEIAIDTTGLNVGEHLGSLCITTNDVSHPLVVVPVRLVVTEGGVALAFEPSSLDFGDDVHVGTTSPPQTAVLTNLGSSDATGLSLTAADGGFEVDASACGDTLPGGSSCEVSVTFAPPEPGPAAATVTATSDQGPATALELTGIGVQDPPRIEIDPDSLSSTLWGGKTETQPLTIANSGDLPLDWQVTEEGEIAGRILKPTGPATLPTTRRAPDSVEGVTRAVGAGDTDAVASHRFPEPLGDQVTITHSESMNIIFFQQGTACFNEDEPPSTVENHFLRTFSLSDFGILGPFDITEVTFGVRTLDTEADIEVNLYTLEGEFIFDNLTLIGSATTHLTSQFRTLVTVPVTGTAPADSTLVVEIEAPDLTGVGAFTPGSNSLGETAPSYLASEACDLPEPTPYADIGFPEVHLVMTVTGNAQPPDCTLPAWSEIDPLSGSVPARSEAELAVTFDATGLDPGKYAANLCVSSNDPDQPLTTVPLALTVTPPAVALTFEPASLEFGDVEVGGTSAPLSATLHNGGVEAASELTFDLGDGAFIADSGNCGGSLPAGESCTVGVTFSATEPGPATAMLQATSAEGASADLGLSGNGVAAGVVTPTGLEVDPEELLSDGNGVFEPGEVVVVAPWWRNDGTLPKSLTGMAAQFVGPDGVPHTVEEESASYGTLDPGQSKSCLDNDTCYALVVGDPAARPATHWEATFDEALDDAADTGKTWTLHIGGSFTDVPPASLFYSSIETLLHSGITGGCVDDRYCPDGVNTRAQMPVFVLKALEGADYTPPPCEEGETEFADVPAANPFCPWIEDLAGRGIVAGCGNDNYCPSAPVTRAQMAIFLLKALEGADYTPSECSNRFDDVPCPSLFADWIEELAARDITGGCSETEYCPGAPVSRAQMAVFVTKTFGLTLYGP